MIDDKYVDEIIDMIFNHNPDTTYIKDDIKIIYYRLIVGDDTTAILFTATVKSSLYEDGMLIAFVEEVDYCEMVEYYFDILSVYEPGHCRLIYINNMSRTINPIYDEPWGGWNLGNIKAQETVDNNSVYYCEEDDDNYFIVCFDDIGISLIGESIFVGRVVPKENFIVNNLCNNLKLLDKL